MRAAQPVANRDRAGANAGRRAVTSRTLYGCGTLAYGAAKQKRAIYVRLYCNSERGTHTSDADIEEFYFVYETTCSTRAETVFSTLLLRERAAERLGTRSLRLRLRTRAVRLFAATAALNSAAGRRTIENDTSFSPND